MTEEIKLMGHPIDNLKGSKVVLRRGDKWIVLKTEYEGKGIFYLKLIETDGSSYMSRWCDAQGRSTNDEARLDIVSITLPANVEAEEIRFMGYKLTDLEGATARYRDKGAFTIREVTQLAKNEFGVIDSEGDRSRHRGDGKNKIKSEWDIISIEPLKKRKEADTTQETLSERHSTHGAFKDNAKLTQEFMAIAQAGINYDNMTDIQKTSVFMILHKLARALSGDSNYLDHWHDIIGYSQRVTEEINDELT